MYKETKALLENTIFEARIKDNKIITYKISPIEGYKLHEISLDTPVIDKETGFPTEETTLGYTTAYVTTEGVYDFEKNEREIYAVKVGM